MGYRSRPRVEAFYSRKAKDPKLHLEVNCDGLRYVPVADEDGYSAERCGLAIADFPSINALGLAQWARPCRMCSLEHVLSSVLTVKGRDRRIFATFSSQPSYGADASRFVEKKISESGAERLLRLAARLELDTALTKVGPVAYGFVPAARAKILSRNLRTQISETITEVPSSAYMSTFWTFLDDAPPELASLVEDPSECDPWVVAELLVGR